MSFSVPCLMLKPSPFGSYAVLWSVHNGRPMINRILLSSPVTSVEEKLRRHYPGILRRSCSEIHELIEKIDHFFRGESVRFDLDKVCIDRCPSFQQKVLMAEHQVPRGHVTTYRRLAIHIKNPAASRAVGNALAGNPFPIIIPCHRAVRSDLTTGGFQGGTGMKQALLELEGHRFNAGTHLIRPKLFY